MPNVSKTTLSAKSKNAPIGSSPIFKVAQEVTTLCPHVHRSMLSAVACLNKMPKDKTGYCTHRIIACNDEAAKLLYTPEMPKEEE